MRLSSIFALAVLAAAISACGGSGGGGGGSSVSVNPPPVSPNPPPTPNPALTRQGLADPSDKAASSGDRVSSFFTSEQQYATELQDKPAAAAAMRPRSGSVTQSSNGRAGVTLDSVDVSIADGRVRATNNGRTLGDVALSLTGDDIQRLFDIGLDNEGLRLLYINTASLGSFGRFAAWGVWIDVPRNAGVQPTVGAFADADSAPYFPQSRLSSLTGTAAYTGTASAL